MTKKLPQKTREHDLEVESRRKFENLLPTGWLFHRPNTEHEYGIDGVVELSCGNDIKGFEFKIQLKATDSEREPHSVSIKQTTYNYYQNISQQMPVLMVRYHAKSGNFYVKWFHDFDPYYNKKGKIKKNNDKKNTISFYWNEEDLWIDGITSNKLLKDVELFINIKNHNITRPFNFYVKCIPNFRFNNCIAKLENRLGDIPFINLFYTKTEDCVGIIDIKAYESKCHFYNNTGLVIHYNDINDEMTFVEILILQLAYAFKNIRYIHESVALLDLIVDSKSILRSIDIVNITLDLILELRDWDKLRRFATNIIKILDNLEDEFKLQIRIKIHIFLLNNKYAIPSEEVLNILKMNINSHSAPEDFEAQSHEYYNLGNYIGQDNPKNAIKFYNKARKLNPKYLQSDYFLRELAGLLFRTGRYKLSAYFYKKAFRINKEKNILPLYADTLMYLGNYYYAHKVFERYLKTTNEEDFNGEWYLKNLILKNIIKKLGIKRQNRTFKKFMEAQVYLTNINEHKEEDIIGLLEIDALCPRAWVLLSNFIEDELESTFALICACVPYNDLELLAISFIRHQILNKEKNILSFALVHFGALKDAYTFYKEVSKIVRKSNRINAKETYLKQLYTILSDIRKSIPNKIQLRLLHDEDISILDIE